MDRTSATAVALFPTVKVLGGGALAVRSFAMSAVEAGQDRSLT
jgi:hypothetical protein